MLNILFQDVQVLAELPLKEGNRLAFKELKLSYYNVETLLFTVYPHHINFLSSLTATQEKQWAIIPAGSPASTGRLF